MIETTVFNSDPGSFGFTIGHPTSVISRAPRTKEPCPVCKGTGAVDYGRGLTRCPIQHRSILHGRCYVTTEFAEDWRRDQLDKRTDRDVDDG